MTQIDATSLARAAVQRRGQRDFRNPSQQTLWVSMTTAILDTLDHLGYRLELAVPENCPRCGHPTGTATFEGDGEEREFAYCRNGACGWSGLS
jgi:hypothetical protein